MTYILMIWTAVAMAGDRHVQQKAYDWRPIGEFSRADFCESAANQLGIKPDRYRCVRNR